jgi:hypothetical protein
MPLSEPAPRTAIHVRRVECQGFQREDGLWDIEGYMTDVKTHVHQRRDGGVPRAPGEPIHQMRVRLTIDLDFLIHDCEAVTESAPYAGCGDIAPAFKALIGPGWRRRTLEVLGGTRGCTHLLELLGPMATTAYQTTGRARAARDQDQPSDKRPYQIDSCHTYRSDGPAVLERWPAWHTGPGKATARS